jgi:hypothetical protein
MIEKVGNIIDEISEGREAFVENSEDCTEASKHLQKIVDPNEAVVTGLGSEVVLLHHLLLLMIMIIVTKMMMMMIMMMIMIIIM